MTKSCDGGPEEPRVSRVHARWHKPNLEFYGHNRASNECFDHANRFDAHATQTNYASAATKDFTFEPAVLWFMNALPPPPLPPLADSVQVTFMVKAAASAKA